LRITATDTDAAILGLSLLLEVQLHAWRGRLCVRISAHVYNKRSDVMRLAEAVARRAHL
jgi:selenocysteine lyase/cysteine desulfurase